MKFVLGQGIFQASKSIVSGFEDPNRE